jgi:hypothetical protein
MRNEQGFFKAGRVSHKLPIQYSSLIFRRCLLVFGRKLWARRRGTKKPTTQIIRESSTSNMRSQTFNVLLSSIPTFCNISVSVGMDLNCEGGDSSAEG